MYVVYLDVLLIINWYMNSLIFYCVTLILNRSLKTRRIVCAGLIGSLMYCMLVACPVLQNIPYAIYSLFIPIISILYLYQPRFLKEFFRYYLMSMFVAGVFGGVMFNLWFMICGGGMATPIDIGLLMGVGFGITFVFYQSFYWMRKRFIFPSFEYELQLEYKGKNLNVQSLLDTGNLLYTPLFHEPVIVVEYQSIKELLTKEQCQSYEVYKASNNMELEQTLCQEIYQPDRLIPFNSVGCKGGYLWGVKLDQVSISIKGAKRQAAGCIIGIYDGELFTDHQYHALLHPEFILEEEIAS